MKYSGLALSCLFAFSGFCSVSTAAEKKAENATPVPQHGSAENPVSRQYYCKLQGGFDNPPDGSGIKNAACKQAYQNGDFEDWRRAAMFNEWAAYSQNLGSPPKKPEEVIPDGKLCSAGKVVTEGDKTYEVYDGINLPSKDWHTSDLAVKDGRVVIKYKASQMHDPSTFRVFFSKAGFDPTQSRLNWADLAESPDVKKEGIPDDPVNKKYLNAGKAIPSSVKVPGSYILNAQLPANYTVTDNNIIVYIAWERDEGPHETFFSCSDVKLKNEG